MNEIEIKSRISEIYSLIKGLKENSFQVSDKPFGDISVNINFLFSFIEVNKEKVIKGLSEEAEKLKKLLNARNERYCKKCILTNRQ